MRKADAVTRLVALLRITACKAVSSGKGNSAPLSPISPPSAPMIAPPVERRPSRYVFAGRVVIGKTTPDAM